MFQANHEIVEMIIDADVDSVNIRDCTGWTALHWAVSLTSNNLLAALEPSAFVPPLFAMY